MSNPNIIRLRANDIDGTVRGRTGIPDIMKQGLQAEQDRGVMVTGNTGRAFIRLAELLGNDWNVVFSSNAVLALEDGIRIGRRANFEQGQSPKYHLLSEEELIATLSVAKELQEMVNAVVYCPMDPRERAILWTPKRDAESLASFRPSFSEATTAVTNDEILRANGTSFMGILRADNPGKITIIPNKVTCIDDATGNEVDVTHESVREITARLVTIGLEVTSNLGQIVITPQGINKGSALLEISDMSGVPFKEMAVGGDDINDINAFEQTQGQDKQELGEIVVVGSLALSSDIN